MSRSPQGDLIIAGSLLLMDRQSSAPCRSGTQEGDRFPWTLSIGNREIVAKGVVMRVSKPALGKFRYGKFLNLDTRSLIIIEQLSRYASSIDTGSDAPRHSCNGGNTESLSYCFPWNDRKEEGALCQDSRSLFWKSLVQFHMFWRHQLDERYDFRKVEERWQRYWEEQKTFKVTEDASKPKYYCLEMFPYPSGRIHMGHVRNYAIGDVVSRYKRMNGFNVLHPMGWDSFGLPAENAAIKHGIHPSKWTLENIAFMRDKQLKRMGLSYDWDREVTTCLEDYYRWNQWFFIKMYERGLAYKKLSYVNWCPSCGTALNRAGGGWSLLALRFGRHT
jgi:hypothetical protein